MQIFRGLEACVREEYPLAPLTSYKVGGPAQYYAEPADAKQLGEVLRRTYDSGLPLYVLGYGTNLLIADRGVRGVVLHLPKAGFGKLKREGLHVCVGAGLSLPYLVNWSVAQGLSGLECLVGVPGTVGAALRMNAGGKYGELGTRVKSVWGCEFNGQPFHFLPGECGFVYRDSNLKSRLVAGCTLELEPAKANLGREFMRRVIEEKRTTQPLWMRSAGCVFKNPKLENVPPAGKLIDDLGMKGLKVGGACVSFRHANFLVCEGQAKAADLAELIRRIRQRVSLERGVELELEIAAWGFGADELCAPKEGKTAQAA